MKTKTEIKELMIQAWQDNDESIKDMIIVDLLLDIRDLLQNPPREIINVNEENQAKMGITAS